VSATIASSCGPVRTAPAVSQTRPNRSRARLKSGPKRSERDSNPRATEPPPTVFETSKPLPTESTSAFDRANVVAAEAQSHTALILRELPDVGRQPDQRAPCLGSGYVGLQPANAATSGGIGMPETVRFRKSKRCQRRYRLSSEGAVGPRSTGLLLLPQCDSPLRLVGPPRRFETRALAQGRNRMHCGLLSRIRTLPPPTPRSVAGPKTGRSGAGVRMLLRPTTDVRGTDRCQRPAASASARLRRCSRAAEWLHKSNAQRLLRAFARGLDVSCSAR
jgi:hypothetical protein